jgi:hypothetical protein
MLDRDHQRRAQLRLVFLEPGEGLLEQIGDARAPIAATSLLRLGK